MTLIIKGLLYYIPLTDLLYIIIQRLYLLSS